MQRLIHIYRDVTFLKFKFCRMLYDCFHFINAATNALCDNIVTENNPDDIMPYPFKKTFFYTVYYSICINSHPCPVTYIIRFQANG